jgi:hypothetical protein
MTVIEMRQVKDLAFIRLLNAVVSFNGARLNGSAQEIIAADAELSAAQEESQQLLYATEWRG